MHIGFLGAGHMGRGMVACLLRNGLRVTVWERSPGRHAALQALGANVSPRIRDVVRQTDSVIGCLFDTAVTRACYLGEDVEGGGIVHNARPGQVLIEHGTFDPRLAVEITRAAEGRGATFLDAPVSGGPERAGSGTLVTMVGGPHDALDGVRQVLANYCSQIEWAGASGNGLRLKLVNQLLVSVHVAAAAEATALVLRSGIDPDVARRVLMGGWAASTMLERTMPRVVQAEYSGSGATIDKLVEAQPLIAAQLDAARVQAPMFTAARARFDEAMARGDGDLDLAALAGPILEDGG